MNTAGSASEIHAAFSVVSGGWGNMGKGHLSSIGGGESNFVDGYASSISGGMQSSAIGSFAHIGGGSGNKITGDYGAILGGQSNRASGLAAMALGSNATARNDYSAVFGFQSPNRDGVCESVEEESISFCAPGGVFVNGANIEQVIDDLQAQILELRQIIQDSESAVTFAPSATVGKEAAEKASAGDNEESSLFINGPLIGGVVGAMIVVGAVVGIVTIVLRRKAVIRRTQHEVTRAAAYVQTSPGGRATTTLRSVDTEL
jgi:hypothetical protein